MGCYLSRLLARRVSQGAIERQRSVSEKTTLEPCGCVAVQLLLIPVGQEELKAREACPLSTYRKYHSRRINEGELS